MSLNHSSSAFRLADGVVSVETSSDVIEYNIRLRVESALGYPVQSLQTQLVDAVRMAFPDDDGNVRNLIEHVQMISQGSPYIISKILLEIISNISSLSEISPEEKLLHSLFGSPLRPKFLQFKINAGNRANKILEKIKNEDETLDDFDKWIEIRCLENRELNKASIESSFKQFFSEFCKDDKELEKTTRDSIAKYLSREKSETVKIFIGSVERLVKLQSIRAPQAIINNEVTLIVSRFGKYAPPDMLRQKYAEFIDSLSDSLHVPLLGKAMNLKTWAERIVMSGNIAGLYSKYANIDEKEELHDLLYYFLYYSDRELQKEFYASFLEYVNSNHVSPSDVEGIAKYMFHYIDDITPYLPKSVGAIQNTDVLKRTYELHQQEFIEKAQVFRAEEWKEGGIAPHMEAIDARNELLSANDKISRFFLNYPSPSFLKAAITSWNSEISSGAPTNRKRPRKDARVKPGQKVPLVSDQEKNSFNWMINNLPTSGRGRDDRRGVHSFLMSLVDRRYYREDDIVVEFMSDAIVHIKNNFLKPGEAISHETKAAQQEVALAFANFASLFASLTKKLQRSFFTQLYTKLKTARALHPDKKLLASDYEELSRTIINSLVNTLLSHAESLSATEKEALKQHIASNQEIWKNEDLLIKLAKYHSFALEGGKKATEQYMLQLVRSEIVDGKFVRLDRYNGKDGEMKKWMGESLITAMQTGYEKNVDITEKIENSKKTSFNNIWLDILYHLNLPVLPMEELKEHIKNIGGENEIYETLLALLTDIYARVIEGDEFGVSEITSWRSTFQTILLDENFSGCHEVLINLDQLLHVQTRRVNTTSEFTFRVTESPTHFITSAEKPYYTCQRIIEPTRYNKNGEPLNRIRQGQFILAQALVGGNVDTRTILEIACEKTTGKKILLVERLYSLLGVQASTFQDQVIDWAISTNEIDFVVFSDSYKGAKKLPIGLVEISLLPSDGGVYRDTTWFDKARAVVLR